MSARNLSIATLILAASASAQSHVWTVGGAGADFADLPPAVAAAADGDTLLVRPGPYSGFAAFDKALSISADPAGSAQIAGEVRIEDLAAGKAFVLSGFVVTSANAYGSNALRLRNNAGAIRIQGSSFFGHDGVAYIDPGKQAAFVANSADVVFTSCTLRGGTGFNGYGPGHGGPGLFARASRIALYDCTLRGGNGGSDTAEEGYDGGWAGHGFESPDGLVFASGCLFQGGAGGHGGEEDGYPPDFGNYAGNGGAGGDGLRLGSIQPSGVDPEARLLDCTELGGPGGQGGNGFWRGNGSPGPAGLPIRVFNGVVTPIAGTARVLTTVTPVRESSVLQLTCRGEPGDRVWLLISSATSWTWLDAQHGVRVPGWPGLRGVLLGTIGSSGQLDTQLGLGELGPGIEARTRFIQSLHVDAAGAGTLGSPWSSTVLDQQF